ncbi:protein phosphatase 1 regulatory inhibitor subunit 16A [Aphelenchoides avenae]|nr:protein phosphatase 1 regulatory inhibitor subunit 16A [Aphelenchus avenae]
MTIQHLDHAALIAELPEIEKLDAPQRILLAKERRRQQLASNHERENRLPPPPPRNPRLRFRPEVALLEATSRGDANEVARLLNMEHADPNSHNEDGLTPLHQCAIDNNQEIVQILLAAGADVNAKDTELWTPLHAAACCGYIQIVRLLIAHGADLLAVNADGNMPYDICDDEATLDVIETEMANSGITQEYIDERRSEPERKMLNDMKALHQAGVAIKDERNERDGSTYLHVAAANGYYDVAAFLIRCDCNVNARDNDLWTPMHAASSWNQPDIIELLFEYGGDINAKTGSQETVLDLCEDIQTRQVILTLQQTEARRRKPNVRDSRRNRRSIRRNKFESPQQATTSVSHENVFERGGVRGSLRQKELGEKISKKEMKEDRDNLSRSWSKEDVNQFNDVSSIPGGRPSVQDKNKDSPSKRPHGKGQHKKPAADAEWATALAAGTNADEGEENGPGRGTRARSSTKRKKKSKTPTDTVPLQDRGPGQPLSGPGNVTSMNGSGLGPGIKTMPTYPDRQKKGCCCVIL